MQIVTLGAEAVLWSWGSQLVCKIRVLPLHNYNLHVLVVYNYITAHSLNRFSPVKTISSGYFYGFWWRFFDKFIDCKINSVITIIWLEHFLKKNYEYFFTGSSMKLFREGHWNNSNFMINRYVLLTLFACVLMWMKR